METWQFFPNFFKNISSNLSRKFREIFRHMHIFMAEGLAAPDDSEFPKALVEKSMET